MVALEKIVNSDEELESDEESNEVEDLEEENDVTAEADSDDSDAEDQPEEGEEGHDQPNSPPVVKQKKQKSMLDNYKILGTAKNKKSRIEASSKLLKYISGKSSEYPYMLKRLLLGLASPSEHSRQSHFVCLVEFIRQNKIPNSDIQEGVQNYLKVTGKGEEGVYMLGQILAQMAILRSGATISKQEKLDILQNICSNGSKKNYLTLAAFDGIIEFFVVDESLDSDALLTSVADRFKLDVAEATLDTLYFICAVINNRNTNADVSMKYFGFKKIGKDKFVDNAVNVITSTSLPIESVVNHPAFKEMAKALTSQRCSRKFLGKLLPDMKASNYKAQIAGTLVKEILINSPESIEEVLNNEMLELIVHLSEKGLGESVLPIIELLDARVKSDKEFATKLLPKLLTSCVCWDKFVPGTLVNDILSKGDKDLVISSGKLFMDKFFSDAKASERVYSASMLAKVVGNPAVIEDIQWRVGILCSLFEHTVFGVEATTTMPQLSRDARYQLKEVFYRGLDGNCKTLADNVNMVHGCMTRAIELVPGGNCLKDEAKASWAKVTKLVTSLHKEWSKSQDKETGMFLLLFCHIGLQLFSQADMAIDVLSELIPLHSNWTKGKASKSTDTSGVEIVVEIMLSLLAQNKHILRNLVQTIFKLISSQMSKPAIQSMLDTIKGEGEGGTEDSDEEMENDAEEEESDNEEDSDGDEGDESENEDSESEEEDEDQDEEEKDVDESTVKKIETALGEHVEADEESDIDMDDIPDEEMRKLDEKLVQAFKALGGRKSSFEKKKERLDHLAQQHFKLRVLDLIDIYIQHKPSVENICIIIPAILESYQKLYTNKKEATLCNKMKSVLMKCSHLKLDTDPNIDTSKLLEYIVRLSCNTALNAMGLSQVVSRLCVVSLRLCLEDHGTAAQNLYMDTLKNYYENKGGFINHELFVGAVSVAWEGAQVIAQEVLEKTFSPEVRHFQRTQGLSILRSYLQNKKLLETFPDQYKKSTKTITEKVISNLATYLEKSKPNQISELFDIMRVSKQQGMLGEQDLELARSALEQFATSDSKLLNIPKVKKSLKKILSFYQMKVQIRTPQASAPARPEQNGEEGKKKKKKKNKGKKKKKEERIEDGEEDVESAPSFKRCLIDTTKVYVNTDKKKGRKRKHKQKDEEKETIEAKTEPDIVLKKKKNKKSSDATEKQINGTDVSPKKSKNKKQKV